MAHLKKYIFICTVCDRKYNYAIIFDELCWTSVFFLNGSFPDSFFSLSAFQQIFYKHCCWLDSNAEPLVMKATALPTVPQPLPSFYILGFRKTIFISPLSKCFLYVTSLASV